MIGRVAKATARGLVLLGCLALLGGAGTVAYFSLPHDDRKKEVRLIVADGEPFARIARRLGEAGLVRVPRLFSLLARVQKKDTQVMAGEYPLHSSMSPRQILSTLCRGNVVLLKVTIPEGTTVSGVATILQEGGVADREAVLRLGHQAQFAASQGVDAPSLEGYLFPETYFFAKGLGCAEVLHTMVQRFREFYAVAAKTRKNGSDFTTHQVVTLASIIEKETGRQEEKPLIASVLINRLKRGIPLQCDPTVIYGIKDFDGNLTRKHLQTPSPYNTYTLKGLPAGPICNPGLESLRAVLAPAETTYLYFVSRNDGSHVFSSTLSEHNRFVQKYQKRRRRIQ